MAFNTKTVLSQSCSQLMAEHNKDSGAGHSCPQCGTLYCPAKTFSTCTTVRGYSYLGPLLPTLLARVSDLQCGLKPLPAYS